MPKLSTENIELSIDPTNGVLTLCVSALSKAELERLVASLLQLEQLESLSIGLLNDRRESRRTREELEHLKANIWATLAENPGLDKRGVSQLLMVRFRDLGKPMRELVQEGYVLQKGKARAACYYVNPDTTLP